jgi:hypothetical protein
VPRCIPPAARFTVTTLRLFGCHYARCAGLRRAPPTHRHYDTLRTTASGCRLLHTRLRFTVAGCGVPATRHLPTPVYCRDVATFVLLPATAVLRCARCLNLPNGDFRVYSRFPGDVVFGPPANIATFTLLWLVDSHYAVVRTLLPRCSSIFPHGTTTPRDSNVLERCHRAGY